MREGSATKSFYCLSVTFLLIHCQWRMRKRNASQKTQMLWGISKNLHLLKYNHSIRQLNVQKKFRKRHCQQEKAKIRRGGHLSCLYGDSQEKTSTPNLLSTNWSRNSEGRGLNFPQPDIMILIDTFLPVFTYFPTFLIKNLANFYKHPSKLYQLFNFTIIF